MVWFSMVWYGFLCYGMVWFGRVWYGMVWQGMVWLQIYGTRHNELDGMRATNSPPAKVNSDCIVKNHLL